MSLEAMKKEFWGDVQSSLYTDNSALYLAARDLENVIQEDGKKAHRPILSHPDTGPYQKYQDIEFQEKTSEDQYLEVDTYEYSAEEIDYVDKHQSPYDMTMRSLESIRKGLLNRVEQVYLQQISDALHEISGSPVTIDSESDALDVLQEAGGKLGAFDAPKGTKNRAAVLDPFTVAALRRAKADRQTTLGDETLKNGVVGPWKGWTIVENNNVPWSATFTLATNPTAGDTVTIAGVTFKFVDSLSDPGDVLIEDAVADTRSNFKAAVEGGSGEGEDYNDIDLRYRMMFRRSRRVRCTDDEDMAFTGYGGIATKADLTDGDDGWSNEKVESIMQIRGAIDLVLQFIDIKIGDKEKGFADLPKGLIGCGAKMFSDGQILSVKVDVDASGFAA